MRKPFSFLLPCLLAVGLSLVATPVLASDDFAPYGRAQVDMHASPALDMVWDVAFEQPEELSALYGFLHFTRRQTDGHMVVVTHGPELRAFAIENYGKYQGIVDQLAELAEQGVEFRMCGQAMRAAGFEAEDMHGFITVIPVAFAELALWQQRGYAYMKPATYPVRGVRALEDPDEF